MLYNSATNKAAGEQDYALFNGTDAEISSISLGDEGWTMQVKPKGKTGLYEIRNQDTIIDYMVQAGMGDRVIFQMTHDLSKQFNDFDANVDMPQPSFTGDTQEAGQARSRSAISANTKISIATGMDLYRPVERLEFDTQTEQGLQKAGTYKYYSLSKGQNLYKPNLVDISIEMLVDRNYVFNEEGNLKTTITPDEFEGRVTFSEEALKNNSVNIYLKDYLTNELLSDEDSPSSFRLISATRDAAHALSKLNPNSPHISSNALDFGVDTNNNTDLDFWYKKYSEAKSKGIKIELEFPSTKDPLYRTLKEKYGDMIQWRSHATGVHVHVEKI
jgi:hypothetical protein